MVDYIKDIPGQLSDIDKRAIISIARSLPESATIVEVGSLYGLSSWIWSKYSSGNSRVFCIDPWKHENWIDKVKAQFNATDLSLEAFQINVSDCNNISTIQGYSPDCALDWSLPIDLYFDDADHRNPVLARNIEFWTSHIRPGGIASGHDFSEWHPDVIAEVERLSERWRSPIETLGGVWWVRKPI